MSKPVDSLQALSDPRKWRRCANRIGAALTLTSGALSAGAARRARAQRDRALRDLAAAHGLLRREAQLEHELRDVSAAAASGDMSEHDLADIAARRLRDLLGTTTAAIRRADADGLTLVGYCGPPHSPTRLAWDGRTSAAEAVRTSRLARVENYGPPNDEAAAFVNAHQLTCGISAPLHLHGRTWGSLTVTTARPGGFTSEDERLLDRFAKLVAAPLATARAHDHIQFRARLEEALREVASASAAGSMAEPLLGTLATERIADLLDSPGAALVGVRDGRLMLLGAVGAGPEPHDSEVDGRSAVAEAIRTGAPVVIDHYARLDSPYNVFAQEAGCLAGVAVPVFLGDEVWGGFGALLRPTISPSEAVLLMERFATIISAALANAQAQERLRFRARFEEALREVATAGAAPGVRERALAELAAERIAELLGARVAGVVRFGPDGPILLGTGGESELAVVRPERPRLGRRDRRAHRCDSRDRRRRRTRRSVRTLRQGDGLPRLDGGARIRRR